MLEATRGGAVWYVDKQRQAKNPQPGVVVTRPEPPVLPAGNIGFFTANEAQKYTLCDQVKETRQEVAELRGHLLTELEWAIFDRDLLAGFFNHAHLGVHL